MAAIEFAHAGGAGKGAQIFIRDRKGRALEKIVQSYRVSTAHPKEKQKLPKSSIAYKAGREKALRASLEQDRK